MTGTVSDLITLALKDSGILGVGQSAAAEDMNDAFTKANEILAQWNRQRFIIYHLIDINLPMTGAISYTVGPGGDFNVPRPDRLEAAFLRQTSGANPVTPIDYPLSIIPSYEDYAQIALKNLNTNISYCVFYDSGWPLGKVFPYPVPSSSYALHLIVKDQLTAFTNLAQVISLPPEYSSALRYTLCCWLRPAYGLEPDPQIVALAKTAMQIIRGANVQIPLLGTPAGMPGMSAGGRGAFNVYSGGFGPGN